MLILLIKSPASKKKKKKRSEKNPSDTYILDIKLLQEPQRYSSGAAGRGTGGLPIHRHQQDFDLDLFLLCCISSAWIVSQKFVFVAPFRQRLLSAPLLSKLVAARQGLHQRGTSLFIWIPNCPILQEKSCRSISICLKVRMWLVYFSVDKWHFTHSSGFVSLLPNKNQGQLSVLLLQRQPTLRVWRYMSSFSLLTSLGLFSAFSEILMQFTECDVTFVEMNWLVLTQRDKTLCSAPLL